jgi:thioester reductase-like protein
MRTTDGLILTGATGLLGRYLLRDLLMTGRRVVVLARDSRISSAADRIGAIVDFWSRSLGHDLFRPTILNADLADSHLGLQAGDRAWLARHCRGIVHAAAKVSMRRASDGEPWRTNVDGTGRLLDLCADLDHGEFHHISTAFVCGARPGPIRERDLDCGQQFHNDYERSKHEAERLVRSAERVRTTVYRPSVIVGDSQTGYTSTYHGFYRFLDLANRLAAPGDSAGRRKLALRLPCAGGAPRDLVPVDWVSQAVVQIVSRPRWHGRAFHLTARRPVPARLIRAVTEQVLDIDGVRFAGPDPISDPTPMEKTFLDHVQEYWPYLHGDPKFDRENTRAALANLPAPRVGRAMLARMVRFARAQRWGRRDRTDTVGRARRDCADYLETFFPEAARKSVLARIPLTVTVGLDIRGPGGGQWLCRWADGELLAVRRAACSTADVTYQLDVPTFMAVVRGTITPQEGFFERRIEIAGDVETALKLAVLFGQLAEEFPYGPQPRQEARDAVACPG